ncbi:hypothetical protein Rhopal_000972-T1 [Rhodotorula paludigena]|uniref:Uncharacterized protein n=1 Tax=Rhodotorula paludigena TaxID=86838 RepID=A0AAV5GEF3_9BASI|nr:hypothetical protein Rhopal_000972-T1 [Rhodotorula paludigena]
MSCTATPFFGVFVKATSLVLTADAWRTVRPAVLALDLLESRQRGGTLASSSSVTSFASLPPEVLQVVREQLGAIALANQEDSFVRNFHCPPNSGWRCPRGRRYTTTHFEECDRCCEWFEDDGGFQSLWPQLTLTFQRVEAFLGDFGLCLAQTSAYTTEGFLFGDSAAAAGIALPLHLEGGSLKHPRLPVYEHYGEGEQHEVFSFSPELLDQLSKHGYRFRRLFALFPLEMADISVYKPYLPSCDKSLSLEAAVKEAAEVKQEETEKSDTEEAKPRATTMASQVPNAPTTLREPRWIVWMTTYDSW